MTPKEERSWERRKQNMKEMLEKLGLTQEEFERRYRQLCDESTRRNSPVRGDTIGDRVDSDEEFENWEKSFKNKYTEEDWQKVLQIYYSQFGFPMRDWSKKGKLITNGKLE